MTSPKRARDEVSTPLPSKKVTGSLLSDERFEVVANKAMNIIEHVNRCLPKNKFSSYADSDFDVKPPLTLFSQFPFHEEHEIREFDDGVPPKLEKIPKMIEKLPDECQTPYCHVVASDKAESVVNWEVKMDSHFDYCSRSSFILIPLVNS